MSNIYESCHYDHEQWRMGEKYREVIQVVENVDRVVVQEKGDKDLAWKYVKGRLSGAAELFLNHLFHISLPFNPPFLALGLQISIPHTRSPFQ